MSFKTLFAGALLAALLPLTAAAGPITVTDPYARAASPVAMSGAAFMEITNTGDAPDRLIAARSDRAQRVELHTHKDMGDGVMKMMEVAEGWEIAPGDTLYLARGGNHVMLMGLNGPMQQDESFSVTLVFEKAGEIVIDVPVDLERQPQMGGMNHGAMGHGAMNHGQMSN